MDKFNVIIYNPNVQSFEYYDIIPYLLKAYNNLDKKPTGWEDIKNFIKRECQYKFWGRCEYELILSDWPTQKHEEKWDIYHQIVMNIDIVTEIIMRAI